MWEYELAEQRIGGWRAVSAAASQGNKKLPSRSVFVQTPVSSGQRLHARAHKSEIPPEDVCLSPAGRVQRYAPGGANQRFKERTSSKVLSHKIMLN